MSPKVAHTRMKIQPTEWGKMPTIPILNKKKYMKKDFFHSCMISCFSCVGLFVTLWTVAHQAPLSMGFYRQEYWNRLHALLQGIFPTQLLNPSLCVSCISSHVLYLLHHLITWLEKMIKNRHTFY